jgi:thiazole/oxazole-forming peptide maturase SagD family component
MSASGKGGMAVENGLAEAVERYAASVVPSSLPIARQNELDGPFVAPLELYGFRREQATILGYSCGEQPISWTIASSVGPNARSVYVPASAVYTRLPDGPYIKLAGPFTTNGLACAPTLELAVGAGFSEVIERDMFFRVWYGQHPAIGIRAESVADSDTRAAIDEFGACRLKVNLLYLGVKCGIHVVAACCSDRSGATQRPAFVLGLGRDLVPSRALASAVLEMGQVYRGLTWALRDPSVGARAEQICLNPTLVHDPLDHALFYAWRRDLSPPDSLLPAKTRELSEFKTRPTTGAASVAMPSAVFVELTPPDVAQVSSWRVARVIVPRTIPYHVGPNQIPLEMLKLSSISELPEKMWVHPLC